MRSAHVHTCAMYMRVHAGACAVRVATHHADDPLVHPAPRRGFARRHGVPRPLGPAGARHPPRSYSLPGLSWLPQPLRRRARPPCARERALHRSPSLRSVSAVLAVLPRTARYNEQFVARLVFVAVKQSGDASVGRQSGWPPAARGLAARVLAPRRARRRRVRELKGRGGWRRAAMVLDQVDRAYWACVVGAGGLAEAIIERLVVLKFKVVICCRRSGCGV